MKTRKELIEMCKKFFLDYINNFLTVDYLCEYYQLEKDECIKMLVIGRYYHEKEVNCGTR